MSFGASFEVPDRAPHGRRYPDLSFTRSAMLLRRQIVGRRFKEEKTIDVSLFYKAETTCIILHELMNRRRADEPMPYPLRLFIALLCPGENDDSECLEYKFYRALTSCCALTSHRLHLAMNQQHQLCGNFSLL